MKLVKIAHFSKDKSLLISLLKLMRNISKYHFLSRGVLLNSVIDIHCSTAEGGTDQNCMTADIKREAFKSFDLAKVINE